MISRQSPVASGIENLATGSIEGWWHRLGAGVLFSAKSPGTRREIHRNIGVLKRALSRHRLLARVQDDEESYMAEVQPGEKGSFLFVENHCPICVAATITAEKRSYQAGAFLPDC